MIGILPIEYNEHTEQTTRQRYKIMCSKGHEFISEAADDKDAMNLPCPGCAIEKAEEKDKEADKKLNKAKRDLFINLLEPFKEEITETLIEDGLIKMYLEKGKLKVIKVSKSELYGV